MGSVMQAYVARNGAGDEHSLGSLDDDMARIRGESPMAVEQKVDEAASSASPPERYEPRSDSGSNGGGLGAVDEEKERGSKRPRREASARRSTDSTNRVAWSMITKGGRLIRDKSFTKIKSASNGNSSPEPESRGPRAQTPDRTASPVANGRRVKRSPMKGRRSQEPGTLPGLPKKPEEMPSNEPAPVEGAAATTAAAADLTAKGFAKEPMPWEVKPPATQDPAKYNNDFCAVCKGPGRFLCCESCPRSFHFYCLDPPLDDEILPDEAWHCRICTSRRWPPRKHPRGIFSQLLDQLDRRIPEIYLLPAHVRNYFQGVATNEEGEYIDTNETKPPKLGRKGYAEERDPHILKDKHGKAVLCFSCGKSAIDSSGIVMCDHCTCAWHLDCLNPPLTVLPSSARRWMCPNHAYHEQPKLRIPRRSKVREACLTRGFVNKGNIAVDNSEEESKERKALAARLGEIDKFELDHVVYSLPESGLKLDFIDRVKR